MSLYHLNRSVIQRSSGNSVSKALSYIHRTKIRDESVGKTYSFHPKEGEIVESKIYIPEGASSEVKNLFASYLDSPQDGIASFASLIERVEDEIIDQRCKTEATRESYRSRMQMGVMEVVGLQKELSLEQNREILDQYIETVYMPRGLLVSSAIHFEEENPHAHLFVSLRAVNEEGFSPRKERELMTRAGLKFCREAWAEVTNDYFKSLGLENRISHKSFKALGIQLIPTIHEGDARYTRFSKVEVETNKTRNEQIRAKNRELLKNEPERLLPLLMSKRVTFTEANVLKEFLKVFPEEISKAQSLAFQLLSRDEVVQLNPTPRGKIRYTTLSYLQSQGALLEGAQNLHQGGDRYGLKEGFVSKIITKGFNDLSREQKRAVLEVTQGRALNLVIGKAGTGKSTLMEAVAQSYQSKGYRVFGGAWSGAAAEELGQTIGIPSQTLMSWFQKWETFEEKVYNPKSAGGFFRSGFFLNDYKQQLNHKTVFILDEAGTVDVENMSKLLIRAHAVGAKVILVGDSSQTTPIGPGEAFRALCGIYPASKLESIKRQKEPWMREASQKLSQHDVANGLKAYEQQKCLHWHDKHAVHQALIKNYLSTYQPGTNQVALAQRNEDVFLLNVSLHTKLKESGQLGRKSLLVKTQTSFGTPTVEFTVKDRILFLQNDHHGKVVKTIQGKRHGITNGTLGTLMRVKSDELKVKLDDARIVSLNPKAYPYLSHGYAMTINKAQGKTVNTSYVLINSPMEVSSTYVALTRHQKDCRIYVNQDKFRDTEQLIRAIGWEKEFDFISSLDRDRVREEKQLTRLERQELSERVSDSLQNKGDKQLKEVESYPIPQIEHSM